MVKITNGVDTFEVTTGAFDGIYSHQGFRKVSDAKAKTQPQASVPQKSEDELFCEEVMEKPLTQWNKDEVKRFAAINDIDISGTKNANEAKGLIKAFLEA